MTLCIGDVRSRFQNDRFLLQNMISFIGLFCKRELYLDDLVYL